MSLRKGKKIGGSAGDKYASQVGNTYGGFDETGLSLVYSYFALRVPRDGAVFTFLLSLESHNLSSQATDNPRSVFRI